MTIDPGAGLPALKELGPILERPQVIDTLDKAKNLSIASGANDQEISLVDLSGKYALAPAKDGSLYLSFAGQSASFKFASIANKMIVGDGQASVLWFYPNTM